MKLHQASKSFLSKVVEPHTSNKDEARREFILNVLLVGLLFLTFATFVINVLHPVFYPNSEGANPLISGFIFLFLLILLQVSKHKRSRSAALTFLSVLITTGIYMEYFWGADLPVLLLFFALLIVMSGILIGARFAFILALICGISIILFSYLEITSIYKSHNSWKLESIHMVDSIVYAIILGIIAIVSWLSNRELEKALIRARKSEVAVRKQRDSLEVIVEKRTRELKQVQAEKLSQLYRFAEFGRMASGLFHDLATPLTLVSLNLDRLQRQNNKSDLTKISDSKLLMKRALDGTHRLENFIVAARQQIQNIDTLENFNLSKEIDQAVQILEYKAHKNKVKIVEDITNRIVIYGNPAKFSQVITNLISNAIDAYSAVRSGDKKVEIRLYRVKNTACLEVQDWGSGIDEKNIPHVFEPLFTTKRVDRGMGMGLSICKDVVEKEFKGKIDVVSSKEKGTVIKVLIPIKKSVKK